MGRIHPNVILGALALALGLVLALLWAPLDAENGVVFTRRGKYSIGDGLAPVVAGAVLMIAGVLLLLGPREKDAPRLPGRSFGYLALLILLAAISFGLMRYTGPLLALGQEGGYRPLRADLPWKYIGFLLGGTVFVAGLISLVEGRLSWRAVLIGLGSAAVIALAYDLPFEDLLLPPNGDV